MRYALLLAAALMVSVVAVVPHETVQAAQDTAAKTVTLDVKMFCGSCPYIVRKSLEAVPGVAVAKTDYALRGMCRNSNFPRGEGHWAHPACHAGNATGQTRNVG